MDQTKPPGVEFAHIFISQSQFSHRIGYLTAPITGQRVNSQFMVEYEVLLRNDEKAAIGHLRVRSVPDTEEVYDILVEVTAVANVIEGAENMPLKLFMESSVPPTLYPFAREAVASLTGRGKFGPVFLTPFNFVANPLKEEPKKRTARVSSTKSVKSRRPR